MLMSRGEQSTEGRGLLVAVEPGESGIHPLQYSALATGIRYAGERHLQQLRQQERATAEPSPADLLAAIAPLHAGLERVHAII